MIDLAQLTAAVEAGDRQAAVQVTEAAIREGLSAQEILDAMTLAMDTVGGRFSSGEIFVPEMLISARAMKEAMALLEPLIANAGIEPAHTAVIGTVKGDLHDIGKNLVAVMWKGAGIGIVDLGTNVPAEQFILAAKEHGADLIGVSALLTTTMGAMRDVVTAVRAGDLPNAKVIVGGAPLTADFALEIGADGYAPDAGAAVVVARSLLGEVALG